MPLILDDQLALLVITQLVTDRVTANQVLAELFDQKKLLREILNKESDLMSQTQTTDQQFQTELAGIKEDMAKQTSVTNGVKVFIAGLGQKLDDALAHAVSQGATEDELTALKQLRTELNANTDALAAASTENTPSQGEPTTPVEPVTTVPSTTDDSGTVVVGDTSGSATVQE